MNPVKLSDNNAAQIHAEDMLATQELSHWTTDGMKPYMKYSVNGGTYAVAQNAAMQWTYGNGNIANFRLDLCGSNDFFCVTSEIKSAIDSLEYEMMYNDMDCCDNGHRDNILDKYHTHVSIGIAYNSYEITYIQNFENQYITWIQPITYNEKAGNIFMKGTLAEAVEIKGINMYFDANPTPTSYEQHRDDTFYSFGDLASVVVSPAPPGWYYDKPSDYTLIEAETWDISGQDFEISFDSNRVTDLHGSGVYTVVMFVTDGGNDWDATTSSLFVQ